MADEGKGLQPDPLSTSCIGTRSSELSDETVEKYEKLKCLHFMGEYRMCLSAFYQFHQNYIHGEFSSCKVYKERVKNCIKWKTSRSLEAKEKLIRSLEDEQKNMNTPNPVWKLRDRPPDDW